MPNGPALVPQPWHLAEPPPPLPPSTAPPLLLLLHRDQPLPEGQRAALALSLSPAERQRLSAYRRPADQERFLLARASLRVLLGHWLALPPAAVTFRLGPHGKPHGDQPGAPAFNLSHAGDLILLAVHASQPVGVDVERQRPELDWPAIVRRVLAPAELAQLLALPEAHQPSAFLAAWCRLEARLKARGLGLGQLQRLHAEGPAAPPEHLWEVAVPPGHAAALAVAALPSMPACRM